MTAHLEHALRPGSQLHQYRVERTIGGGGFSIVYLAVDTTDQRKVIIKEYLPSTQAQRLADDSVESISTENTSSFRQGMKRFFDEAATLSRITHPNIVRVTDFFRENNTVYIVMNFEEGKDLRWQIRRYGGTLSEKFIRTVFPQVLEGLKALHAASLLHLDIKPANILIRPGGRPLLLDFGATQKAYADNRPLGPHTLTPGYAPIEQHNRGHVGPWTDVYALGATIYACMGGRAPPPALTRAENDSYKPAAKAFARRYSRQLLDLVDWCLLTDQARRPQKADDLLAAFAQPAESVPEAAPTLLDRLGSMISRVRRE